MAHLPWKTTQFCQNTLYVSDCKLLLKCSFPMNLNVSQLADGVFIGWLGGPSSGRSVIISKKDGKLHFHAPIGTLVFIYPFEQICPGNFPVLFTQPPLQSLRGRHTKIVSNHKLFFFTWYFGGFFFILAGFFLAINKIIVKNFSN